MKDGQIPTLDEWNDQEDQQLKLDMQASDFERDLRREYLRTHPWLKFNIDLKQAPPRFWLLLGEAKAACLALSTVPIPPAMAQELHRIYLIKGVHSTTAIEGNTLTEEQVRQVAEQKLELPPSQEYLQREVKNILRACGALSERAVSGRPSEMTPRLIRSFNKTVLAGLEVEEGVVPGEIRRYSVGVARYRAAPAEDCPFLLAKLCTWLNELRKQATGLEEEIIRAVVAHVYLAWIHPFGDGNGRTARLMEFQILINGGIPTPAAHLMSNHYNLTRARYLSELDAASKSGGNLVPFLLYALEGFVEQLNEQMALISGQQLGLAWRDFVNGLFSKKSTPAHRRRRELLLALSWLLEPVPKDEIRTLSPELEKAYRSKTDKTITRDLNWLVDQGLLREEPEGYLAQRELILGFLPARRDRRLASETARQKKLAQGLLRRLKESEEPTE